MSKHLYHLELAVKGDFESKSQIVSPGWKHVATNLELLAGFVFNIVREYEGDFHQRKITLLSVSRYTEADEKQKKINGGYGKGFFGWNWHVKFDEVTLKDINKFKINKKTEKKFKKELVKFWKSGFADHDAFYEKIAKQVMKKSKVK